MSAVTSAPGSTGFFEILEPGTRRRHATAVSLVIGRDLVIRPDALDDYCMKYLPRREDDLLLIAGAVALADKVVRRKDATDWARHFNLVVPVLEPEFWAHLRVSAALSSLLRLLTGDAWHFEFALRRSALAARNQRPLPLAGRPAVVMPFSDGLDSLAVARLTAAYEPEAGLILVTVGKLRDPDAEWRVRQFKDRYHRVRLPFSTPRNEGRVRFRENSYRSRAFLFGVVSGIAASRLGAPRVLVPESGQGSLGPALTPVGNEAPDVRMHPVFTRALSDFLALVLGQRIQYEHPQLWWTKGETLGKLRDAGLTEDWGRTRSCARDGRDVRIGKRRVQCGVCASCLLRRQSLRVAGFDEAGDGYLWSRLSAADLATAAAEGARPTRRNDERHAVCGVLAMAELASLGRERGRTASVDWASADLAAALDLCPSDVRQRLQRLLDAHRTEWDGFVSAQGAASFVARLADLVPN